MSEIKLQPDEIAAYKYAKYRKIINEDVIKSFIGGCEHKNNEPIVKRLESIVVTLNEELQGKLQGKRVRDVNEQRYSDDAKFIRDIKHELQVIQAQLKNYKKDL